MSKFIVKGGTMTGREIKQMRRKMGLTQEGLAKRMGVSPFTVRRWEKGISKPSPMAQKLMATVAEMANPPDPSVGR